jgi:membrane protease YdiL (CAAX protease family)
MFTHLGDLTKAAIFYAVAFGLVLVVAGAPFPEERKLLLSTFTPAVSVLIVLLVATRDGYSRSGWADLGLHRPGFRRWLAALVAPLLLIGAAYSAAWISGAVPLARGIDAERLITVVVDTLVAIAISTATYSLGEELGWSGYLLPRLARLGHERAGVLRGLLHALWHFPLIFLTTTYLTHGDRFITVPLFVVTLTCAGLAYGYFRFSTESVWPCALAHAAFNNLASAFDSLSDQSSPTTMAYLVGEGGVLMAAGAVVLAAWAVWRMRVHRRSLSPAAVAAVIPDLRRSPAR